MKKNFQKIFTMFLIVMMAGVLALPFNSAEGIEYYQRTWTQTTKTDFQAGVLDKTKIILEALPDDAGIVLDQRVYCPDGDLTIDGVVQEISGDKKYCDVNIINGGILRFVMGERILAPGVGEPQGEILTMHAYSIYIDETSSIDGKGKGDAGGGGNFPGHGFCFPYGPECSVLSFGGGAAGKSCFIGGAKGAGGGGGGYGGVGSSGSGCTGGEGGCVCGAEGGEGLLRGSGGGGGNLYFEVGNSNEGGTGGMGGGAVLLDAVNINIKGTINMNGANGEDGKNNKGGGGGGGSGGTIIIKGRSVDISGIFNVNGGNGGYSDNGIGGAGGGGRIKIFYEGGLGDIVASYSYGNGSLYKKGIVYIPSALIDPAICGGNLMIDGATVELSGEKTYCAVEIVRGSVLTTPQGETLTIRTNSVYIDETSSINLDAKGFLAGAGPGAGGQGAQGDNGEFFNMKYADGGGGGAGHHSFGGDGETGSFDATGGAGGVAYGTTNDESLELGSGGGDSGYLVHFNAGLGGNGGGAIFIEAPNISILGDIFARAADGTDGKYNPPPFPEAYAGGGGGSGGAVIIKGASVDISGITIDVSAGNGGSGSTGGGLFGGNGGGGSGGRIKIFHQGVLQDTGVTYVTTKGIKGAGGNGGGQDGGNGNVYTENLLIYDPTFPMVSEYFASGSFASQVYEIPDYDKMLSFDEIKWSATIELGVTGISLQVRADDNSFTRNADFPTWISIGNTSPVSVGLPAGKYVQWRTNLTTTDPENKTPILHDVTITYTPDYPPPTGDFNVSGWAWSDIIGWISFNYENCYPSGPAGCPPVIIVGYGVDIDEDTGEISGYAWSENVGWISFEESDLIGCHVGSCKAMANMFTGEVSGWAKILCSDSWIRLRDTSYGVNIMEAGEFHNWAWSDDYGWISFNCAEGGDCGNVDYKVVTSLPLISLPYAEDLGFSPDYCLAIKGKGHINLEWTYRNGSGNAQAEFNLQIAANPAKNPDGTFTNSLVNFEDVDQPVALDGVGTSGIDVVILSSGTQEVPYNDHYYWQVQIEDVVGGVSDWIEGPEFDTPLHPYPYPDFILTPEHPSIGEEIQLCSTLGGDCVEDVSVCYNAAGGEISCTGQGFNWTIPEAIFTDGDKFSENPKIEFDAPGDGKVIKLGIIDTGITIGNGNCGVGCCEKLQTIDVSLPLPNWKEIIPF